MENEICECGHLWVNHHDGNGVWGKGCNQPLAMELQCPCQKTANQQWLESETATLTAQLNEMREALRELCDATKDARLLYAYGVIQMPTDYEDSRANQTRCEGEAKLMLSKIDFAHTKAKALLDKSRED